MSEVSESTKFTAENFNSGFLMDEELMAGISQKPNQPGIFTAFVVRHTTGETLGIQEFNDVFEAIRTINDIPRDWIFEKVSKCGSGNCANGKCSKGAGGCGKKSSPTESASQDSSPAASSSESCSTGSCDV